MCKNGRTAQSTQIRPANITYHFWIRESLRFVDSSFLFSIMPTAEKAQCIKCKYLSYSLSTLPLSFVYHYMLNKNFHKWFYKEFSVYLHLPANRIKLYSNGKFYHNIAVSSNLGLYSSGQWTRTHIILHEYDEKPKNSHFYIHTFPLNSQ